MENTFNNKTDKENSENIIESDINCKNNGDEDFTSPKMEVKKEIVNDEPSELSFETYPENSEEKAKRKLIEKAINDPNSRLDTWLSFAKSEYGLVNDDLRKIVWPLLLNVDTNKLDNVPTLEELKNHKEYEQVVLDVNRSLRRFPPGIPLKHRLALQDQLTVVILRVITKYPHLSYFQGYHDVAITFLLVTGDAVAYHIMEILSTKHLAECMQKTFETVQKRLLTVFAIIYREKKELFEFLEKSQCGLLFALPWYLTWFGHSLNTYKSVVRLYDYFLASDPLLPLYVSAAIVLYREDEIFREDCDRASLHCLLSRLPEDLPFEYLLNYSQKLFEKYPPHEIQRDIDVIIERERKMREEEDKMHETRKQMIQQHRNRTVSRSFFMSYSFSRRSIIVTTAFSIVVGFFAYYLRSKDNLLFDVIR